MFMVQIELTEIKKAFDDVKMQERVLTMICNDRISRAHRIEQSWAVWNVWQRQREVSKDGGSELFQRTMANYVSFWNFLDWISLVLQWALIMVSFGGQVQLDLMDILAAVATLLLTIRYSIHIHTCLSLRHIMGSLCFDPRFLIAAICTSVCQINWSRVWEHLAGFQQFAHLVKTIMQIMKDITSFLVLLVILLGKSQQPNMLLPRLHIHFVSSK